MLSTGIDEPSSTALTFAAAVYACLCRAIKEVDVVRAGQDGAVTPERLVAVLGLNDAGCCGRCAKRIDVFVALASRGAALSREGSASPISTVVG